MKNRQEGGEKIEDNLLAFPADERVGTLKKEAFTIVCVLGA